MFPGHRAGSRLGLTGRSAIPQKGPLGFFGVLIRPDADLAHAGGKNLAAALPGGYRRLDGLLTGAAADLVYRTSCNYRSACGFISNSNSYLRLRLTLCEVTFPKPFLVNSDKRLSFTRHCNCGHRLRAVSMGVREEQYGESRLYTKEGSSM